jgi:hypothetical protein
MGFLLGLFFFLDGAGETLFEPMRHANIAALQAARGGAMARRRDARPG